LVYTPMIILVRVIIYKCVAIPLLWTILQKKGNSNTTERKAIMAEFIALFGVTSILYLCADREFIGKVWFQWLMANQISFRIRVRENTKMTNGRGQVVAARRLFRHQANNQTLSFAKTRLIGRCELFVTGMRMASGEDIH